LLVGVLISAFSWGAGTLIANQIDTATSDDEPDADYRPANVSVGTAEGPTGRPENLLIVRVDHLHDDDHVVVSPEPRDPHSKTLIEGYRVLHSVGLDNPDKEVVVYSVSLDRERVTVHYRGPFGKVEDGGQQ